MRRITTLAASVIAASALFAPAAVDAAKRDQPTICERAYEVRQQVIKKHGKRAPGRNICRHGVQSKFNTDWDKPASVRQKAKYLRALRAMNTSLPMMYAGSPRVAPAGTATPRAGGHLAAIRACESGGNYATNTGNGFYGAYQFDMQTWASVGGSGNPAAASPAEQDKRAAMLYARRGAAPWPVCGR